LAQHFADKGIGVFICEPGSKRPLANHSWYLRQSDDREEIAEWFNQTANANYGLHLGEQFVAIDLDRKPTADGVTAFEELCREHGIENFLLELDTLISETPGGGYHIFFRVPFGVANRNSFPDGIDVRGVVGYVVGPGSADSRGEWKLVDPDAEIAEIPEWLLSYLEKPGYKDPNNDAPVVELDEPENIAHAVEWLKHREPAIQGHSGDDWTFETIQFLRDFGLSQEQIFATLDESGWNGRCDPPWGDGELEVKIRNAWTYGQNRPGCKAPTYRVEKLTAVRPDYSKLTDAQWSELTGHRVGSLRLAVDNTALAVDDIPLADTARAPDDDPESDRPRRRTFKPRSEAAQDRQPDIEWLIRGVLQRETLTLFYGPENSFKSFLVLDMAMCAAAGLPWASYGGGDDAGGYGTARQLATIYIAGEGSHGIERKRRPAWRTAREMTAPVPFYTVNEMPSFASPEEVESLIADIREAGVSPDIIVIDTAARAMVGLDENSAKDTGLFVAACDRLKREFRCCVVVVHHSGKNAANGARGSTNLPASFDARFKVTADTASLVATIKNEKQKDGDPWERPVTFRGEKVHGSLVFRRQAPTGQNVPTAEDKRRAEVREALAACGGLEGIVSTPVLAAALARRKLDETPGAREKAGLIDEDRIAKNEARNLQRQAKDRSDGSPGLLGLFVVGSPTGGELSWMIPTEEGE
jgi:hypothetical protein